MFQPSSYQQQVFDRIAAGQGNTVVEAVAGSGKTTTIVEALRYTPPGARVVLLAYSTPVAKELSRRVLGRAHVRTLHSLGLAALRNAGECEIYEKKTGRILSGWLSGSDGRTFREMLHLVSLAKGTLVDAHDADAVREMADHGGPGARCQRRPLRLRRRAGDNSAHERRAGEERSRPAGDRRNTDRHRPQAGGGGCE